jgi:hypothetical protein
MKALMKEENGESQEKDARKSINVKKRSLEVKSSPVGVNAPDGVKTYFLQVKKSIKLDL